MNRKSIIAVLSAFMMLLGACGEDNGHVAGNADDQDQIADTEKTGDDKTDTGDDKTDTGDDKTDTGDDKTDTGDDKTDTGDDTTDTGDDKTDTGDDTTDTGDDTVTPPEKTAPKADLMDLVFTNDNKAKNVVNNGLDISNISGSRIINYSNPRYAKLSIPYVAHFNNPLGSKGGGCYKVDYSNQQQFKNALSDGHSLEAVFRLDAAHDGTSEAKFFSSHSSGGTGFLISKKEKGNSITFLPYVGGGYKWCDSKIVPEVGKYYHVVGVWDKAAGKAHIYVDGKLSGTVDAAGDFSFGSENWFGVGCDAGSNSESSWNGDVAVARVYDKPLTADDVSLLYENTKLADSKHFVIKNVDALGTCQLAKNYKYNIYGSGFKAGDAIRFESMSSTKTHNLTTTLDSKGAFVTGIIPDGLTTGQYRSVLVRGNDVYPLAWGTVTMTANPPTQANVNCVAHQGYHPKGVSANSIASLREAQKLGCYGSEFDVHITLDGGLFVYHDRKIGNVDIQESKKSQVEKLKLSNGEKIPTLEAYLKEGQKVPSVKLVLELKSQGKTSKYSYNENNKRLTQACIDLVKKLKMEEQVEWISFNYNNCLQVKKALPDAMVQYLASTSDNAKTPADLNKKHLSLDYKESLLKNHLGWIADAHKNKQVVNVWTVGKADFNYWIGKGVDSITTNDSKDLMNTSRIYVKK